MPSGGNPENPLKQNNTILNLNENTGEKVMLHFHIKIYLE